MFDLSREDIVRPRLARAEGTPRLLFVGRVEPSKGITELLDALVALRDSERSVEVHLVGWAAELEHYRGEAARLGLENVVVFHGVVKDRARLRALYMESDLFVFPTHTEGFPRVLYEALAFGVPILTTFVGGIPALMRHEENCLEIPVKDAAGLACVLTRALDDPDLREKIAAGGYETIRAFLDPARPSHAKQVADAVERG
jgi:glycosyltransferase involved in cell wall biosynthesis